MPMHDQGFKRNTERVSLINGVPLVVPSAFSGILPVSPCDLDFAFEASTLLGLQAVLWPSATVFDIGASYGVMTVLAATLVGPEGCVHSFEAIQSVQNLGRELVVANGLAMRTKHVNVCVGERTGGPVDFYVISGFGSVASSRNAGITKNVPETQRIRVPLLALDDYCEAEQIVPDCLKLDIEGGEYMALKGARQLLERRRPDLIIETHGLEIDGIGGSLSLMCHELGTLGYGLFDLESGNSVTPDEYSNQYRTGNGHLLASTKLQEPGFVVALVKQCQSVTASLLKSSSLWADLDLARTFVNSGRVSDAVPLLERLLFEVPNYRDLHYLLAYCLQLTRADVQGALEHYSVALENGFDEFWVRYNRGMLLREMGDFAAARADLARVLELQPENEAVRQVWLSVLGEQAR